MQRRPSRLVRTSRKPVAEHCCVRCDTCCSRVWRRVCGLRAVRRVAGLSPVQSMLLSTAVGVAVGCGLFYGLPKTANRKVVADWLAYFGICFLRVMKSFDLPLIAVNVAVGISGVVRLEQAGRVGIRTGLLYLLTSVMASATGVAAFIAVQHLSVVLYDGVTLPSSFVALQCANGMYAVPDAGGGLACTGSDPQSAAMQATAFVRDSVDGTMVRSGSEALLSTNGATVLRALVDDLTPASIAGAVASNNVLGVVFASVIFGLAVANVTPEGGQARNVVADVLLQMRQALALITRTIMKAANVAAMSLIAGALVGCKSPLSALADVGLLWLGVVMGFAFHSLVAMPLLMVVLTGTGNPYAYLAHFRTSYWQSLISAHPEDALEGTVTTAVERVSQAVLRRPSAT